MIVDGLVALEDQVLAFLADNPWSTAGEVCFGVGGRRRDVYDCLRQLFLEDVVVMVWQRGEGVMRHRVTNGAVASLCEAVAALPPLVVQCGALRDPRLP